MENTFVFNPDHVLDVFNAIVADRENSKLALKAPSEVFEKFGLTVSDAKLVDTSFYEVFPNVKAHFLASASGKPNQEAVLGCSSPKCIACKSGLYVTAAAPIALALAGFPEDEAAIVALGTLIGLAPGAVIAALTNCKGIPEAVTNLCVALGAC